MLFEFFGSRKKAIIGMAHIGALPGAPLYDFKRGMNGLIDGVIADVERLQAGGVDAIMFGNENDRPYEFKVDPASTATMGSPTDLPATSVSCTIRSLLPTRDSCFMVATTSPVTRAMSIASFLFIFQNTSLEVQGS